MTKNIAVIGGGYWGKNLVRNFATLGALCTICDADAGVLESLISQYPGVNSSPDYHEVLADEDVRGIVIATPAACHYSMAKEALLAGKDVFVEKPLAESSKDAQELTELATGRGRFLMVGHLLVYHPAVQLLKQYIKSGELGEIYYLYSTRVNLGQIRRDESALWRLLPHDIALFIYLLDQVPSVISAQGSSYVQDGLVDVVFIALRFGTVLAHVHASWLDPHKIRQLTVVGSKKMAIFDDMEVSTKLRIHDKYVVANRKAASPAGALTFRSGEVTLPQIDLTEPLHLECQHFIHCLERRCQPLSDGKQGLEVVRILEAIQKAMEKKKEFEIGVL